ncbi:MAG: serine/threonine protein kinase, partial [Thalassolituus oleivorans]
MTGTTISHYRIVKELGKGGMGVVYKAEDTKLDRTVALKLLAPHMLSSESDRARFYREARAAAALHHPNIATIFEIDETGDGSPFIAMEYVDGAQLDDGLKLKPLPVDEAIAIAVQIAEALKAAHDGGIVHRDIKSANIMLTKDGVAKVLDFGLAKTDASTKLTQMGSTVGTIAYMSPEQARGEEVDHRTDLWSLGTVLYEMLTGQLPFPGAYEQAVVYGILNAEAEPVTSLRTAVGAEVELIVQKCLRKERDHRYQSAADLLADLKSLDLTVSGRSKTSKAPGPRGSRVSTPKWVWGALAAAALLGFAGAWIVKRPADVHPRPLRRVDLQVGSASEAIAIAPDGRLIVTVSDDEGYSAYDTETATWVRELDVRFGWRHEFSPSGEWLLNSGGPTAPGLARLRVSDNRSVPILNDGMGATWLTENTVLFTSSVDSSLWRVDIDGENAALVASKDYARGHVGLYFPDVLPGGDFAVAHGWSGQSRDVVLADLRTGEYEV